MNEKTATLVRNYAEATKMNLKVAKALWHNTPNRARLRARWRAVVALHRGAVQ